MYRLVCNENKYLLDMYSSKRKKENIPNDVFNIQKSMSNPYNNFYDQDILLLCIYWWEAYILLRFLLYTGPFHADNCLQNSGISSISWKDYFCIIGCFIYWYRTSNVKNIDNK